MTQVAPGFAARYRGRVDPSVPLNTAYNYQFTYTIVGQAPTNLAYGVLGPPQLTKENYIELYWTPIVGLIQVTINRAGNIIFQSPGSECGCMDQGQLTSSTTGVRQ